ncbi:hypothetical protein P775_13685 [Puniceibacterium antarcticum]|uniref:Uncharacterized protein n=1 Tax=Puniceibacterium antarcticum TaxID=1206336 RepID=A0A2G8RDG6_9RHOB|nr:hypothetical protein [Puniceibacterium antarcticum]PIL19570.1 hypothetical protein P775_13685 [Puniceibacterium antarcticum]
MRLWTVRAIHPPAPLPLNFNLLNGEGQRVSAVTLPPMLMGE